MNKILTYLLGTSLSVTIMAENRTLEIHPETDGKMLSMEEVYSADTTPENKKYSWRPETSALTYFEQNSLQSLNPIAKLNGEILSDTDIKQLTDSGTAVFVCWIDKDRAVFSAGDTYYIIDVSGKSVDQSFRKPEKAANFTFNPAGPHVYTADNGLYYCDSEGNTGPIAVSSDKNIIFGQTVSRNEFGISGGIFLSPSGKKLAFYRKDESAVGTFPLLDITTRTGSLVEIKYPMAGMASEVISLGIYDFASGSTIYVKPDDFTEEQYLTNISWSPDDRYIFIQVLDRSQKNMHLNMYDAATGAYVRTLLTEHNDRYVEPLDPLRFMKGSNDTFIYRINTRDGYRNLYLCDIEGRIERLTRVDADVDYVFNDGRYVYYTSAEISPVENHLMRIDTKSGKIRRLTGASGWHSVSVSPDGKYFLDSYSNVNTPRIIDLANIAKDTRVNLLTAQDPLAGCAMGELTLGTVKSADGKYDNYYRLIKPVNFDPDKKYPVVLYVYGGPHSQMVKNTWLAQIRHWEIFMSQRGYIIFVMDNRGTMNRGAAYEKTIFRQCGQAEMADQMEGIRMLMSLPFVDKDRIGVHGWSYGGFMTISLTTNYPDIFKVAVAGGPVIDWKWYEVMYGERYMDAPQINPEGYEKTSLISMAKNLRSKLLICQGAVDDVVVWEHSLGFISECIENNIQVDYFPYPLSQHNVASKDRVHLMNKVTAYFDDYL